MDNQDWKDRRSYHKVSGHVDRPRPTNKRRMMFLLLPTAIAILFLGMLFGERTENGTASSTVEVVAVSIEDVNTVINNFASDRWGQETLDKAELLANTLEAVAERDSVQGAATTATYLRLLISGTGHEVADDTMLGDVARYLGEADNENASSQALTRYRQALDNSAAR